MVNLYMRFVILSVLLAAGQLIPLPSETDLSLPSNIRDYFKQRDTLLQDEKSFESRAWTLSEDEMIVDRFFRHLKWKDFQKTKTKGFPPSRQIRKVLPEIRNSELYQLLVKMPKGGNLHSHENQQLSKKTLLDIIWSSKDFGFLYVVMPINSTHPENQWNLDFFVNPPPNEGWVKVIDTDLTKDTLLKTTNFVDGVLDDPSDPGTDSGLRWKIFNSFVERAGSHIINNIEIKRKYIRALYEEGLNQGIIYLETRRSYSSSSLYELDITGASNATNGKRYLTSNNNKVEIEMVLDIQKQFRVENPQFVGHKTIVTAVRSRSQEDFQRSLDTAISLHRTYPNHVIGFDNVGEEDAGFSTLRFIQNYLSDFNEGRAMVPLYLHSVETNWPDDLTASDAEGDLVPTLENAYEAILLQPKRIGHGKGFIKTPYLRQLMKERKIAVEACVISNQILGYEPDLRNHFGQYFFREGIPVVLAPDDPGSFGYDGVVMDWYAAFISWGLNVGDLKKLALNSLEYSGMNDTEKRDAIDKSWKPSWDKYILEMKDMACNRSYDEEAKAESRSVKFNRMLPTYGTVGTKVHVFGRNFEMAICKKPRCIFGNRIVDAVYLSSQHLMCTVPSCDDCNSKVVEVKVALDGAYFVDLGSSFAYDLSGSGVRVNVNVLRTLVLTISVFFSFDKLFNFKCFY